MGGTQAVIPGQCTCGSKTDRRIGGNWVCLECEMRQLAKHCARLPGVRAGDALAGYLGRLATGDEAEAFTRHYLEAAGVDVLPLPAMKLG